jgi:mRNA-degrading endonuclease RelE of RelBE toxin-antitoxin system
MSFQVLLSPDAQKYLDTLDEKRARNIKKHLKELQNDPYKPRSGCDIDIIAASGYPPMRRQRIGKYRAEYFVGEEECTVYVTDIYLKRRDSVYGED